MSVINHFWQSIGRDVCRWHLVYFGMNKTQEKILKFLYDKNDWVVIGDPKQSSKEVISLFKNGKGVVVDALDRLQSNRLIEYISGNEYIKGYKANITAEGIEYVEEHYTLKPKPKNVIELEPIPVNDPMLHNAKKYNTNQLLRMEKEYIASVEQNERAEKANIGLINRTGDINASRAWSYYHQKIDIAKRNLHVVQSELNDRKDADRGNYTLDDEKINWFKDLRIRFKLWNKKSNVFGLFTLSMLMLITHYIPMPTLLIIGVFVLIVAGFFVDRIRKAFVHLAVLSTIVGAFLLCWNTLNADGQEYVSNLVGTLWPWLK